MKNIPKVSVGVPVFNGGKTLARALDSLVSQDYPNIEILISDNSSTDDTWEICQDFSLRYEHIKIVRHEENQGVVNNTAFVTSNATGEYFFLAHHDDWRDSHWVSAMVDALESDPNAVVALGPCIVYGPNSDVKAVLTFNKRLNPSRLPLMLLLVFILFKPTPFLGHVKYNFFILGLLRRELIQKVFEVRGLHHFTDRDFPALLATGGSFTYVDEFRLHKGFSIDTGANEEVRTQGGNFWPLLKISSEMKTPLKRKLALWMIVPLAEINNWCFGIIRYKKRKK